jgi:hypothetical protein
MVTIPIITGITTRIIPTTITIITGTVITGTAGISAQ